MVNRGRGGTENCFVLPATFCGVNTPTMANFKLPVWSLLQYIIEKPQISLNLTSHSVLEPSPPCSWKDGVRSAPMELLPSTGVDFSWRPQKECSVPWLHANLLRFIVFSLRFFFFFFFFFFFWLQLEQMGGSRVGGG